MTWTHQLFWFIFFLYLKNIHVHVKSRYYNQASGPSFGSPSPSERAQGWRESPRRMAPPANLLPVLYPVCEHSAATGLPGKKPLIGWSARRAAAIFVHPASPPFLSPLINRPVNAVTQHFLSAFWKWKRETIRSRNTNRTPYWSLITNLLICPIDWIQLP